MPQDSELLFMWYPKYSWRTFAVCNKMQEWVYCYDKNVSKLYFTFCLPFSKFLRFVELNLIQSFSVLWRNRHHKPSLKCHDKNALHGVLAYNSDGSPGLHYVFRFSKTTSKIFKACRRSSSVNSDESGGYPAILPWSFFDWYIKSWAC